MRPSYEHVFEILADHRSKRLVDFYCCVDVVDSRSAMYQRVQRLVDNVRRELDASNHYWAIRVSQENTYNVYLLVKRETANQQTKKKA